MMPTWKAKIAAKPVTFNGVRFFQTSMGEARFYTGKPTPVPEELKEPLTCRVPRTVSQAMEERNCKFVFVATAQDGTYLKSLTAQVKDVRKFRGAIGDALLNGEAALVRRGYLVHPDIINKHLKIKNQLCQIQKKHSRSLQRIVQRNPALPF